MIHALDHVTVAVHSLEKTVASCELLLGRRADRGNGVAPASFRLANVRLVLEATPASAAEGLCGLAFATTHIDKARRLLERRGLPVQTSTEADSLAVGRSATHGVALSLVARGLDAGSARPSPIVAAEPDAAVTGLDHVVIRSPDPEPRSRATPAACRPW